MYLPNIRHLITFLQHSPRLNLPRIEEGFNHRRIICKTLRYTVGKHMEKATHRLISNWCIGTYLLAWSMYSCTGWWLLNSLIGEHFEAQKSTFFESRTQWVIQCILPQKSIDCSFNPVKLVVLEISSDLSKREQAF